MRSIKLFLPQIKYLPELKQFYKSLLKATDLSDDFLKQSFSISLVPKQEFLRKHEIFIRPFEIKLIPIYFRSRSLEHTSSDKQDTEQLHSVSFITVIPRAQLYNHILKSTALIRNRLTQDLVRKLFVPIYQQAYIRDNATGIIFTDKAERWMSNNLLIPIATTEFRLDQLVEYINRARPDVDRENWLAELANPVKQAKFSLMLAHTTLQVSNKFEFDSDSVRNRETAYRFWTEFDHHAILSLTDSLDAINEIDVIEQIYTKWLHQPELYQQIREQLSDTLYNRLLNAYRSTVKAVLATLESVYEYIYDR